MIKLFFGILLSAWVIAFPIPATAGVDVSVSIALPPPIVFAAPPAMIVLPETYIYVVPDASVDIFFYNGWWWRPWEGRWYRSQHYDSGWAYYQRVPSFYTRVPSGWRNDYRDHRWKGHQWNYQPIPHQQVQQNWKGWEKNRHWEKQQTWGVQGLKTRTRSQPPSQAVQPKSQVKQQHSRPQSGEVQQQQSRPQSQTGKPNVREASEPQHSRPQSGEVQQQHSQQQRREAPQQSKPQQGKPDREEDERHDRK